MGVFVLIFVITCYVTRIDADPPGNSVKIGVIKHGYRHTETETLSRGGQPYVVELEIHYINMTDIYQVYKTVRIVDNMSEYDFIVFINNDVLDMTNTQVVQFRREHVIWGQKPTYALQGVAGYEHSTDTTDYICPVHKDFRLLTYCIDHQSTPANGTTIDKIDTLTAPNIVTGLVTKHLLWTYVIIFHENKTASEVTDLVDKLSQNGVLLALYNIDMMSEWYELFSVLGDTFYKTTTFMSEVDYIVLCHFGCLRKLIRAANAFDINHRNKTLFKQFSHWLIASYSHTSTVAETLDLCASELDNVAVVALPKVSTENSKKGVYDALNNAITSMIYSDDQTSLLEHVKYKMELKSTTWHPAISECHGLRIETLMYTSEGRDFDLVGYVSMNNHDVVIESYLFPNSNYGYNKRKFLVTTLHNPPFVIKRTLENGTTVYEGLCHDLLKELARILNFTYELIEPADKRWGTPDENFTFNGMIGQLQREEVDIVGADISIQMEREKVMDFAYPFYYGDTSVLLKKPDPNIGKWRTLVEPFKWEVLLAIGAVLPIASLLVFLLERFNPFYTHPDNAHLSENSGLRTIIDSFWYMYGALLTQGGANLPESFAGRTFVSFWWIFSIILVGTYCGNLIAFMTVTKEKAPFNTLDEMAELSQTYKWGTQGGTHVEFVFLNSQTPIFRKIGDKMISFNRSDPTVFSMDIGVHLEKVRQGGYGWIGDTVSMEIEMANNCDLLMIEQQFLPRRFAFGFTNNSPHTRIFSDQMLSLHESGLLQVWKRRWWPSSNMCKDPSIPEAKPISLVDVQSAFYVAAAGIVIAFMAFLSEVAVGNYKRHNARAGEVIRVVSVKDGLRESA